VAVNWT